MVDIVDEFDKCNDDGADDDTSINGRPKSLKHVPPPKYIPKEEGDIEIKDNFTNDDINDNDNEEVIFKANYLDENDDLLLQQLVNEILLDEKDVHVSVDGMKEENDDKDSLEDCDDESDDDESDDDASDDENKDGGSIKTRDNNISSNDSNYNSDNRTNSDKNITENESLLPLPNYYNWRDTYPELSILFENIDILKNESKLINSWIPWPEDHYAKKDKKTGSFCHTYIFECMYVYE